MEDLLLEAAPILILVGMPLVIAEGVGSWLFWPVVFRIGIVAFRETLPALPLSQGIAPGTIFDQAEGRFKFMEDREVLFRSRTHLLMFFRLNTPLPFKGSASVRPGYPVEIVGRMPVGALLSFVGLALY